VGEDARERLVREGAQAVSAMHHHRRLRLTR
jgi:hypothetical protein